MLGIVYGKDAAISVDGAAEPTVDGWLINYTGNLVPYVASNTQGGTGRKCGNIDWEGWYRQYGTTPLAFPGQSFAGIFSTDGTLGVSGTARCESTDWYWDLDAGGYIIARTTFGANGALSLAGGVAVDSATPNPSCVKGLYVALDGVQQDNVHKMRLRASRDLRRYVTAENDGQYMRTSGDLDMVGQWQVFEDDPSNYPTIQAMHAVRFYVSSTTYWEITWMRIESVEPFGVDRTDTRNPIGATITASFTGFSGTQAGTVKNPAGSTVWP